MAPGARLGDHLGGALEIGDGLHVDAGEALGERPGHPLDLDRGGAGEHDLLFRLGLVVERDGRGVGLPRQGRGGRDRRERR